MRYGGMREESVDRMQKNGLQIGKLISIKGL